MGDLVFLIIVLIIGFVVYAFLMTYWVQIVCVIGVIVAIVITRRMLIKRKVRNGRLTTEIISDLKAKDAQKNLRSMNIESNAITAQFTTEKDRSYPLRKKLNATEMAMLTKEIVRWLGNDFRAEHIPSEKPHYSSIDMPVGSYDGKTIYRTDTDYYKGHEEWWRITRKQVKPKPQPKVKQSNW